MLSVPVSSTKGFFSLPLLLDSVLSISSVTPCILSAHLYSRHCCLGQLGKGEPNSLELGISWSLCQGFCATTECVSCRTHLVLTPVLPGSIGKQHPRGNLDNLGYGVGVEYSPLQSLLGTILRHIWHKFPKEAQQEWARLPTVVICSNHKLSGLSFFVCVIFLFLLLFSSITSSE